MTKQAGTLIDEPPFTGQCRCGAGPVDKLGYNVDETGRIAGTHSEFVCVRREAGNDGAEHWVYLSGR